MKKQTLYQKIKETLAVASQFIIHAPLRLPEKIVTAARYVALLLGVLEALEQATQEEENTDENG